MSEIAEILERAAARLSKSGEWGQCGATPTRAKGAHCTQTAIAVAAGGFQHAQEAEKAFADHIGVPPTMRGIWEWNDAPERTQEEVVAKLREAAAKARGESEGFSVEGRS